MNSREPFAINVAGNVIYGVTSPVDVQAIFKNTTTVPWLGYVQKIYQWIGFSQLETAKIWHDPSDDEISTNPDRNVAPNEMIEKYQQIQLSVEKMNQAERSFTEHLDTKVSWQTLGTDKTYVTDSTCDSVEISLFDWNSDIFVSTLTEIYWGKRIWDVNPHLVDDFLN